MNKPAKKPAVIAKTARKVRLTASEVGLAKSNNIKLEDFAKAKLPKRGRPVGSKNKKSITKDPFNGDTINWQRLSQQLQVALAAEMKDNEEQQAVIDNLFAEALRIRTPWERVVTLFSGRV